MDIQYISYPLNLNDDVLSSRKVMAIGDFDGVHKGHQNVISRAADIAQKKNLTAATMTFKPHPREVLGHAQYAQCLSPLTDKISLLASLGMSQTLIVKFDTIFAQVSPEDFVKDVLMQLNIDTIVVGFDFTFGNKGLGTADTLQRLCGEHMHIEVVEPFNLEGEKVSSTFIREQLMLGRVDVVPEYLGRHYAISGTVTTGEQRGRTIGFPTANIVPDEPYVIPAQGVYAVLVHWNGNQYPGVMNIGVKPTFHDNALQQLEVHLLDFKEDIYGEQLKVTFVKHLRSEMKFTGIDALVAQIKNDVKQAKQILTSLIE